MTVTRETAKKPNQVVMRTSRVFEDIMRAWLNGKRGILCCGGTSSTKTWSILQFLHVVSSSAIDPLTTSIISESLPHLKLGAMRDFFRVIGSNPDTDLHWHKSDYVYTYKKATIEYWGADNEGKARGPRRSILFVNEANHVPWSVVDSAEPRTEKFIIVDWNPSEEFWVHQYESGGQIVQGWLHDPRFAYSHSTYLDAIAAGVLPQSIIESIESRKDKDPNWWNVFGLGEQGNIEGLVHPKFEQVDELPTGAVFYGLDFGYSRDPTALVKSVILGDKLYSQEIIYQTGLLNDQLARLMDMKGVGHEPILADAADPRSIDELRLKGYNVVAAEKGQGSLEYGIQKVNQYYQFWTKDSLNCIKEQRNYRFKVDRITKKILNDLVDDFNHAMDARRYSVARVMSSGIVKPPSSKYGGRQLVHGRR